MTTFNTDSETHAHTLRQILSPAHTRFCPLISASPRVYLLSILPSYPSRRHENLPHHFEPQCCTAPVTPLKPAVQLCSQTRSHRCITLSCSYLGTFSSILPVEVTPSVSKSLVLRVTKSKNHYKTQCPHILVTFAVISTAGFPVYDSGNLYWILQCHACADSSLVTYQTHELGIAFVCALTFRGGRVVELFIEFFLCCGVYLACRF